MGAKHRRSDRRPPIGTGEGELLGFGGALRARFRTGSARPGTDSPGEADEKTFASKQRRRLPADAVRDPSGADRAQRHGRDSCSGRIRGKPGA